MPLAVGQSLSFYEILGPLGAGGMGEVYRAKDTRLEREVAIKVLPEELADDEDRLRRFEREAKTLASLNHPNVAGIHGIDQVDGICFIAMELVSGEDLAQRLQRGALPVAEALDVCRQIAAGLEAAHEAGVVHRDLKPANARVTSEGLVKVLDFGLAKPMAPEASQRGTSSAQPDSFVMTQEGRLLGTPTYMSPEQARGKPVDKRTDIWAFGCVLFECLSGKRAFDGATMTDLLAAIVHEEPDWAALPASTPGPVRDLLRRTLQKDAQARLRDIGEARITLTAQLAAPAPAREKQEKTARSSGLRWWQVALGAVFLVLFFAWVVGRLSWLPERIWGNEPGAAGEQRGPEVPRTPTSAGAATTAADERPSIAVLPFVNMSGDPENQFFSDGVSEEILNLLAKLGKMRVASRTSAFALRDATLDVPTIAKRLGVEHIVEGSVRRAGDKVRVTVQLIDAEKDTHLWSETYDRKLEDIFAVQDDIAKSIVAALQLTLEPGKVPANEEPETVFEAYELYLRGRSLWHQRGDANLRRAIELFEQAVAIDPEFVRGWSALAVAWSNIPAYSNYLMEDALPKVEEYARRALTLDPEQFDARVVLADCGIHERRWSEVLEAYEGFHAENPGDATCLMWFGDYLWKLGYLERAREIFAQAFKADPAYSPLLASYADVCLRSGDFALARDLARASADLGRDRVGPLAMLAISAGDFAAARAPLTKTLGLLGLDERAVGVLLEGLADASRRPAALAILAGISTGIQERRLGYFDIDFVLDLYHSLHDLDGFFALATAMSEHGYASIEEAFWGPKYRDVRRDPRFEEFVQERGLLDFWREHGWPDECSAAGDGLRCE